MTIEDISLLDYSAEHFITYEHNSDEEIHEEKVIDDVSTFDYLSEHDLVSEHKSEEVHRDDFDIDNVIEDFLSTIKAENTTHVDTINSITIAETQGISESFLLPQYDDRLLMLTSDMMMLMPQSDERLLMPTFDMLMPLSDDLIVMPREVMMPPITVMPTSDILMLMPPFDELMVMPGIVMMIQPPDEFICDIDFLFHGTRPPSEGVMLLPPPDEKIQLLLYDGRMLLAPLDTITTT